jgi:hypothetical protein
MGQKKQEVAAAGQKSRFTVKPKGSLLIMTDLTPEEVKEGEDAFTLASSNGWRNYKKTLSSKDDQIPGDSGIALLFEGLFADAKYTLTVKMRNGQNATLFKDVSYDELAKLSHSLDSEAVEPK